MSYNTPLFIIMKHFDLFSGYGGFSLALEKVYGISNEVEQRGCRQEKSELETSVSVPISEPNERQQAITIGFSEIDKYASSVLKYHWPNTKNYGDITKIDWSTVPDFDLLTGGSPCQDLSIAGKRAGLEGARSGLFYEYMRAVKEKRPKYFIWENVKGALSSNKGFDFAAVLNEMAEAGYSLWWQVLNAKDFGVPQNRERIFVVGFRDGCPREVFFERQSDSNAIKVVGQLNSETWLKRNESTRRVHSPEGLALATPTAQGGGVMTKIISLSNRRTEASLSDTSNCLTARFRGMPDGDGRPAIAVLTPDRLEKRQNGRRFKEDGDLQGLPYDTTSNKCKEEVLDEEKKGLNGAFRIRRLTCVECERLMSLPDSWTAKGIMNDKEVEISDSQRFKLCGNGVVVNVVEEIIKNLITI